MKGGKIEREAKYFMKSLCSAKFEERRQNNHENEEINIAHSWHCKQSLDKICIDKTLMKSFNLS